MGCGNIRGKLIEYFIWIAPSIFGRTGEPLGNFVNGEEMKVATANHSISILVLVHCLSFLLNIVNFSIFLMSGGRAFQVVADLTIKELLLIAVSGTGIIRFPWVALLVFESWNLDWMYTGL